MMRDYLSLVWNTAKKAACVGLTLIVLNGCSDNGKLNKVNFTSKHPPKNMILISHNSNNSSISHPDNIWAWDIDNDKIIDEALRVDNYYAALGGMLPREEIRRIPQNYWRHYVAPDIESDQQYFQTDNTVEMPEDMRRSLTEVYELFH